ncbi:MAG: hypothetical protein ACFUZC_02385 [Chthoniobacteraceae bacterium]
MPSLSPTPEPPVVFVHTGASQVIVTACVAQAKAAGARRIFVISDRLGPWALIPGVERYPFSNAERFGAREFRSVFVNYSTYPPAYAAIIFEKFFAFKGLFETHGLEKILFLDSDLLLFSTPGELAQAYPCDFSGTDCELDHHATVSPHCMFLTPKVCDWICEKLLESFGSEAGREKLRALWEHKKALDPSFGICEMDFLAFARDSGLFRYAKLNQGNPRVDLALGNLEGFTAADGLKAITFEGPHPYGTLEATGERVRFYVLHMQGYLKHFCIHYAQIPWVYQKALYLLWALEQRGWLKWPRSA